LTTDSTFVHHDASCPSSVSVPVVDPNRTPPTGTPPSGPAFPQNALGAICDGLNLPCPPM
jgi:hypothetical protein